MIEAIEEAQCRNLLIHDQHEWDSHEQHDPENAPDEWAPVTYLCRGNADQDDPMDRYECCNHCASGSCPRRDGHPDPCRTCADGATMLGEVKATAR